MLKRIALLVVCCLLLPATSSPLYPALRFGQRAASILMTSIEDPMQLSADSFLQTPDAEFRFGRHADAVFTNSYRKVLGQISARKFLQTVMGKRFGRETQKYVKRQTSIYGDYKQDVDMDVIERGQSYREQQRVKKLMPLLIQPVDDTVANYNLASSSG